jgi:hypothetical protein
MKQMIHPMDLPAPEVGEAAHQAPEVEVLVHLAEPVAAHQGQQKAVHPAVAEVVHQVEAAVHPVVAALQVLEEAALPVAEAALQVVQSKVVHPVVAVVHQVEAEAHPVVAAVLQEVQSKAVLRAVRRKVALQERVHRDDCYSSINHFEISEVLLLSKH